MPGLLENKAAIITGGGSGMGREIALRFAQEGARIMVFDCAEKDADKTVSMIEENGGSAGYVPLDISDSPGVHAAVRKTYEMFSRIDILVNCAGIFRTGTAGDISEAIWHKVMDVNLNGTFLCTKYVLPYMLEGGGGSIINISSEAGLVGIENQVAYNTSKGAVIALTRSTALDYAAKGIRVNCVCPGRVRTPLVDKVIADSQDPALEEKILSSDRPMMRMGAAWEIANACLIFAGDQIPYATGSIFSVDGGYTAR